MTITAIPTVASTTTPRAKVWPRGLVAGAAAAVATTAVAVVSGAIGTSFEDASGESIPLFAFPQLTFIFALVGVAMAAGFARRSATPRRSFTRTTVALTAVSLVPPTLIGVDAATTVTLIVAHLVAAAIVIPSLASKLRS
jgi:hypothetical protein